MRRINKQTCELHGS